jgi:hypothetical protein
MIEVRMNPPTELLTPYKTASSNYNPYSTSRIESNGEMIHRYAFARMCWTMSAIIFALRYIWCTAEISIKIENDTYNSEGIIEVWRPELVMIAENVSEEIQHQLQSIRTIPLVSRDFLLTYRLTRTVTNIIPS